MKLVRVVETAAPPLQVASYLADFTTTMEWDPGTVLTERLTGDGGVGTTYRNVSKFLGRETELTYRVVELTPGERIALVGTNSTVTAHDTMTIEPAGSGSKVTYEVDFDFNGAAGLLSPLLAPAFKRLADKGQEGMERALARLS